MPNINRTYILEGTEALIFDIDDTCQDAIGPKVKQYLDTAKHFGLSDVVTVERIRLEWQRNPFPKLVEVLFGKDLFEEVLFYLIEKYDDYPKALFPETKPTIQALGASGLWLGAVTSVPRSILQRDAGTTGVDWYELFRKVQTADDTNVHKPSGEVFKPTLESLGRVGIDNLDTVIYIGDGMGDLLASRNAGIGFIGVERGFLTRRDFESAGARSVPSIARLINT